MSDKYNEMKLSKFDIFLSFFCIDVFMNWFFFYFLIFILNALFKKYNYTIYINRIGCQLHTGYEYSMLLLLCYYMLVLYCNYIHLDTT